VNSDAKRYNDNLQGEIDGAYLYEALAKSEPDPKLAQVYNRLAIVEKAGCQTVGRQARRSSASRMPRNWHAASSPG
jgi:Fe2+ or Zn2+ uptake regulation protein